MEKITDDYHTERLKCVLTIVSQESFVLFADIILIVRRGIAWWLVCIPHLFWITRRAHIGNLLV